MVRSSPQRISRAVVPTDVILLRDAVRISKERYGLRQEIRGKGFHPAGGHFSKVGLHFTFTLLGLVFRSI